MLYGCLLGELLETKSNSLSRVIFFPPELISSTEILTFALFKVPISASVASPKASNLVDKEHFAARTRAIFPLYFGGACPIKLA